MIGKSEKLPWTACCCISDLHESGSSVTIKVKNREVPGKSMEHLACSISDEEAESAKE